MNSRNFVGTFVGGNAEEAAKYAASKGVEILVNTGARVPYVGLVSGTLPGGPAVGSKRLPRKVRKAHQRALRRLGVWVSVAQPPAPRPSSVPCPW